MTKGQRAMAVALLYPEPKRGRGHVDPAREKGADSASFRRVKEARFILKHAPAAAQEVLIGAEQFEAAYRKAEEERNRQMQEEERAAAFLKS
jgi:hypothetical protein